ncbi:hypothetical protein OIDMADRAFT_172984 [Oidiodendron maius Zn]|uniref:Zn(2)-C6 fungal-type domain-containing protein n=1 Tax=Oidiodendron maius (strain Zn) TaxID=913774 RepID=A0A0C3C4S9_OIDMZ|nr:hypothetical protein OIDMADRAFT_172984 [Oidiodendron maius Zn]
MSLQQGSLTHPCQSRRLTTHTSPRALRSCDRCHEVRKRCSFEGNTDICHRCEKYRIVCVTTRSRQRLGRRPKNMSFCPSSAVQVWELKGLYSGNHRGQDDPRCNSVAENPKPEGRQLENVIGMATFEIAMGLFMFGPSFAHDFHAAIGHLYSTSTLLLQDIYIAILSALQKTRYNNGSICGDDLTKGASSIRKLRTAVITTYQDAAAVTMLGQGIAAFDMLASGTKSNMLLRYSLTLIRPWYSALLRNPSLDPITITPIFWDTVDCLIRREVPIIKFSTRDPQLVDRVAGLCSTLLPILQELCVASYNTKTQRYPNDILDPFTGIEQKLLSWSITPPLDITKTYSTSEIRGMRTQALMYRASGLLLIHRLRNPLGIKDNVARSYADNIVLELLGYLALAKPDERLPNAALPLLLAMLEIPGLPKGLWSKINTPWICITKLCAFVEFIWTARRNGFAGLWFDLVDQGLDFVILP